MTLQRSLYKYLLEWKSSPLRKPLILRGARQVGKTTLIEEFSKQYKQKIFLNLEHKEDKQFLQQYTNLKNILTALFLHNNIDQTEVTLLFIDEVQEYPETLALLRYFFENFPHIHVIVTGSLLEFAINKVQKIPVGRVEYLYLYPFNFHEYLQAKNTKALTALQQVPIKKDKHMVLLNLFHQYVLLGGMPEIVKHSINKVSLQDLSKIYESIWESYKADIEKYTSTKKQRQVVRHILNSLHLYIDQRIKFQNFGNSNYSSKEVKEALHILSMAKVIEVIYPSTDTSAPIKLSLKKHPKIQMLDTGLVNYLLNLQVEMLEITDLNSLHKGAIVPHIINQEILSLNALSNKNTTPFWVREKKQANAEVDILLQYKQLAIPIEIKSGSSGSLKSLHQFVEASTHPYAVQLYSGEFNIREEKTPKGKKYFLMSLPYYLGTKIFSYLEYFTTEWSNE